MKKIVCELCECMEFVKEGDFFVCQGCGTKYTLEHTKSMMTEVEGAAPAASSSSMPANTQQVSNLLILARNAIDAFNNREAEDFCNKIIELDATCHTAWLLKGQAVGWQSTYGNPRVLEAAKAIRKAFEFAPDAEKTQTATNGIVQLANICIGLYGLAEDTFRGSPDANHASKFEEFSRLFTEATTLFKDESRGLFEVCANEWSRQRKGMAEKMNTAGVGAMQFVRERWGKIEHPNTNDLTEYLDWLGVISDLFRKSIEIGEKCGEDKGEIIIRCENLIISLEEPLNAESYIQRWNASLGRLVYVSDKSLSDSAVASRKKEISDYRAKIDKLNATYMAEKADRIEAYWSAHPEEKAALEAERERLEAEKMELENQRKAVISECDALKIDKAKRTTKTPAEVEIETIRAKIVRLKTERDSLSVFQAREKSRIECELEESRASLARLDNQAKGERDAMNTEVDARIAALTTKARVLKADIDKLAGQIAKVTNELTKDRN